MEGFAIIGPNGLSDNRRPSLLTLRLLVLAGHEQGSRGGGGRCDRSGSRLERGTAVHQWPQLAFRATITLG